MWVRLQLVCLPVCLHTSLCGFYHNRDAAVWCDGLGPPVANHIQTHFITPTPSPYALVTNHPESLSIWHAARIRWKARLQKMEHTVALPWLQNLIGMHTRTQRHTLEQRCNVHDVNSDMKRAQTYKPIPLHTFPHSKPSHAFLFWVKESTCPHNHATDDNKDTTERGEERLPGAYTKLPF